MAPTCHVGKCSLPLDCDDYNDFEACRQAICSEMMTAHGVSAGIARMQQFACSIAIGQSSRAPYLPFGPCARASCQLHVDFQTV